MPKLNENCNLNNNSLWKKKFVAKDIHSRFINPYLPDYIIAKAGSIVDCMVTISFTIVKISEEEWLLPKELAKDLLYEYCDSPEIRYYPYAFKVGSNVRCIERGNGYIWKRKYLNRNSFYYVKWYNQPNCFSWISEHNIKQVDEHRTDCTVVEPVQNLHRVEKDRKNGSLVDIVIPCGAQVTVSFKHDKIVHVNSEYGDYFLREDAVPHLIAQN
jgi:hypothetical protein